MTEYNNNRVPERPRNMKTCTCLAILAFTMGWMAILGLTRIFWHPVADTAGCAAAADRNESITNAMAENHGDAPSPPEETATANSKGTMVTPPPPGDQPEAPPATDER